MQKLLSREHLKSLKLGQEFQTPGPLHAITPEDSMVWRLVELLNGYQYVFDLTYLGCKAGRVQAVLLNSGVKVTEL